MSRESAHIGNYHEIVAWHIMAIFVRNDLLSVAYAHSKRLNTIQIVHTKSSQIIILCVCVCVRGVNHVWCKENYIMFVNCNGDLSAPVFDFQVPNEFSKKAHGRRQCDRSQWKICVYAVRTNGTAIL